MPTNETSGRREPRLPCAPRDVRTYTDEYDAPVTGQIVEVSRTGIQLHVDAPLPVGSLVTVDMGGMIVLGDVRHCDLRVDEHYTVGVRTHDVRTH